MREQLRRLKIVITVFSVLIVICLIMIGCVYAFGSGGSSSGTVTVQNNVVGVLIGK